MRITPRAAEVKAVVALLESTDYDSAEALAKDIIKNVGDLFEQREWYSYAWRANKDAFTLLWGPFPSDSEVSRFEKKVALGGEAASFKLNSPAAMLDRMTEAETRKVTCPNCQHPLGAHQHEKRIGQCQVECCGCRSTS